MNDGLKQRLIGAVVILALGVIFLPVIFDRERIEPVDRVSQIPVAPVIEVPKLPEVATAPRPRSEDIAYPISGEFKIGEVDQSPSVEKPKPAAELHSQDGKASAIPESPVSWVLQVASFTSQERVTALRRELENLGYRNFVREVKTVKGEHTRIYVGPSADRPLLVDAKAKIDRKFKLESLILKYGP